MKKLIVALVVFVSIFYCYCNIQIEQADIPEDTQAAAAAEPEDTQIAAAAIMPVPMRETGEPEPTPEPEEEPAEEPEPTEEPAPGAYNDIMLIANVMAGECYIFEYQDMLNVGMSILNRVDSSSPDFPEGLYAVVTQPYQMNYCAGRSIAQEYIDAATEVYNTWIANKAGAGLPWDSSILWWSSTEGSTINYFRSVY